MIPTANDMAQLTSLRAAASAGKAGFVSGNQVTLLQNGDAFFLALEQAFDQARDEIYLATYIYSDDTTGRQIAAALKRAVLRAVRVCVVIDGFGSSDLPPQMRDQMRRDGIDLRVFRRGISPWTLRRTRLRRMHRKIAVVDREIAFVGIGETLNPPTCGQSIWRRRKSFWPRRIFSPAFCFAMRWSMRRGGESKWSCCCREKWKTLSNITHGERSMAACLTLGLKFTNTKKVISTPKWL